MPAFAIKNHAVLAGEIRLGRKLLFNLSYNPRFFLLALKVELVQLFGNLLAAYLVFAGEELDHVARHIHASGGVDARPQTKAHIAGSERTAIRQPGDLHQRLEAAIHRPAEPFKPQPGNNSVLAHQRHGIGDSGNGNHLEKRRNEPRLGLDPPAMGQTDRWPWSW